MFVEFEDSPTDFTGPCLKLIPATHVEAFLLGRIAGRLSETSGDWVGADGWLRVPVRLSEAKGDSNVAPHH